MKEGNIHMQAIVADQKKVRIQRQEKPEVKQGYVLLRTLYSAISPGTELSLIASSDQGERPLGYSAVGMVEEVGEHVSDYKVGDIVACYGAPYVQHAQYLLVPYTLCAKVPESVDVKAAALGGIGAIAIHALRVANLQFGESVVIVGLGVLGQMIAKIAQAAAYNVIAYDLSEERTSMVEKDGIHTVTSVKALHEKINERTNGQGVDAVLLCAGGKRSPLTGQSLDWIRKQGKVVIVGDIEPDFPREKMFEKEAQLLISRAGGPGRYDPVYERAAIDFPYGYVRWTEGRNVGEYIRLVHEDKIDVADFITEIVSLDEITTAYNELLDKTSTVLTKIIQYN